jgi:hypothetical protein
MCLCTRACTTLHGLLTQSRHPFSTITFKVIETPLCDPLGPLRGVCDDLLTTYGEDLLTYLSTKINAKTICTDVDAC